jgi:hypothetical protein
MENIFKECAVVSAFVNNFKSKQNNKKPFTFVYMVEQKKGARVYM